jgi:tetratricopeptide (TPR) repeat protein
LITLLTDIVNEPVLRKQYRGAALESLKNAIAAGYKPEKPLLCYQYALNLAEYGEIDQAIAWAKTALEISTPEKQSHIWNLLALCLACKKDGKRAVLFCETGYNECVAALVKRISVDSPGGVFSWDQVESIDKEELIK